ncbi:OTU domain-containing protein 5-like isoform X2 [Gallus gallus]|uniref:OTU domain-containing protein 5-like isoform X2 n=1 Tax=Gallus gallus TaxID=9031 RepID=UPI001F025EEF|nr:OTU domain-containing protein 5-like isoform X2 [Gallus gallus]XP_046793834.1 OTU domain-containing protein 5-like isoform X2 [Gallus gallus]
MMGVQRGLSGGAVRGADCARGRSGDGGSCGDDDSEGSSRRRPAEGYLWGWPGTATPPRRSPPSPRASALPPALRGGSRSLPPAAGAPSSRQSSLPPGSCLSVRAHFL